MNDLVQRLLSGKPTPLECEAAEALTRAQKENAELREFWNNTEARSAEAHAIYQQEAHRRGDVRHPDDYASLSEATKEWDRVLVRWVASTLKEPR